jgi:hypothetical protein
MRKSKLMAIIVKQKEERSGYAANKDRKNLVAAWNWGMKYMDPPLPGPNPCLVDRMSEVGNRVSAVRYAERGNPMASPPLGQSNRKACCWRYGAR